jgi:hypothetical protein
MDDDRPDARRPDDLSEGELSEREPAVPGHDGSAAAPEATEDTAAPAPDDSPAPDDMVEAADRPTEPVSPVDEADPVAKPSDVDDTVEPDGATGEAVDTTHRPEAEPEEPEVVAESDADTGAAPGDVDVEPVAALWPDDVADRLRSRWQEVQLRFVDEPREAADEADQLVEEVVSTLTKTLQRSRAELGQWRSTSASDSGETEHLRVAVQRYREFLDAVLTL